MYCLPAATMPAVRSDSPPTLGVTVLFTDVRHTLAALQHAGALGRRLHASLRILMPVVVPYPLDISASPVDPRCVCRRLTTIAEGTNIPTRIEVVYCRDRAEALEKTLPPKSILVMCGRQGWNPFDRTARLVRRLRTLGHEVIDVSSA